MAANLEKMIADNRAQVAVLSNPAATPEAVEAASQALAASNPAEVEKTIKSLEPLQVEYNGKLYEDGKEILVSNANKNITVKGLNSDSFNWSLNGTSGSSNPIVFESSLITSSTSLIITQGDRKITTYLKMLSKPNLVRVELIDEKHTNRKATSGEKLYLVGHGDFKATAIASQSEYKNGFQHPDLSWSIDNIDQKNSLNVFRKNFGNNEGTHLVRAEIANGMAYSADVVIVDKYKKDYKIVPGAISAVFDKIKDLDNSVGTTLRKLGTVTGLSPSFKTEIAGTWQNNEVKTDRFVQDEKQVGASAKFGLSSPKDNPIPGLSYKIPYVGQIGGYWRFSTDISLGYNYITITKNNPAKTKSEKVEIPLKASGGLEVGAKVALLPDIETIKIEIKGYGKGAVYGLGRYTPSTKQFNYEVGIDAVVGGFSGTIKAGGFTVFDQKYEKLPAVLSLLTKYRCLLVS